MRVRKYDFDYGRRALMRKAAQGSAAAGVLTSLWPMLTRATTLDTTKAYPEELLSIEVHTKGKIKPGDVITASNLEHVEHLLDPITAKEIRDMGRKIKIKEATTDVSKLFEEEYLEATLRNQGKATFDKAGNVRTKDGRPWIGGNPFPEPESAVEGLFNISLNWGRHNYSKYAFRDWDIGTNGNVEYQYNMVWTELNVTSRTDQKVWNDEEDKLRYNSLWFTRPSEQAGTSFLNVWHYDQRKFPELLGYLPAFKRIRDYPTNQRFEPLVPGLVGYLSDVWGQGDPVLTWGNFKIVDRRPMLGPVSGNWHGGRDENWMIPTHGGPQDQTFFDTVMELVPETIVVDAEPVSYKRSPVGKKRVWLDARNGAMVAYNTYDRKGDLWKTFHLAYSQFVDGDAVFKAENGKGPAWSWVTIHSHDIQTNRLSRMIQVREVDGYVSEYNGDDDQAYEKYMTRRALRRLGA